MRRFGTEHIDEADDEPNVTSDFIKELDRGGLTIPTLATVFFVHSANHLISSIDCCKKNCCSYCSRLISVIEAPMAGNLQACRTLVNILVKARVLDASDTEQRLGCLRRQENTELQTVLNRCITFSSDFPSLKRQIISANDVINFRLLALCSKFIFE